MTHRRWLLLILAAYFALATSYSIVTPLFEISDELWHYPTVDYIANNGFTLPMPDASQPWRQEAGQPPLYYMASALLTTWIDTNDLHSVRRMNPHSDIGVVRPDGNMNMIVHRTQAEAFPWQGTALAVHLVRFFSIMMSLGTIIVTYALARELFPGWPLVALGAAALNAFLPMFLFISASVNNDNLSNLLGNLLTLLIVRMLKAQSLPHWRDYALIGVVTGAGLLSKLNIGFLIPLVALALLVVSVRLRDWRPVVMGGVIAGGLTVMIAGWWYWRNWEIYGDPTGLPGFLNVVGRRLIPANGAQLWSERHSFTQAYWGFFGGMNLPMPDWVYLVFNLIGGISLVSSIFYLLIQLARRTWALERWLPIIVAIVWPVMTFVSYLRWTAETPASQGRLVFGALSAISVWMAAGLMWWLPRRLQPISMLAGAGYFAGIAALVPFVVIIPAYTPPTNITGVSDESTAIFTQPGANATLSLLNTSLITEQLQPDSDVILNTRWRLESPTDRDWSMFIHLTSPDGVILSQRDIYPGGGRLATSDLPTGFTWDNPAVIHVPSTAYAPITLSVNMGWYHLPTGQRLRLADGSEFITVGQVQILPRMSDLDVPNPLSVNFDNQIELVGYALSDLTPSPGETVELTLYWRALQPISKNYTVFAHIIDLRNFTIYAGSDTWPVQGNAPTTTWEVGQIIEDTHSLTLREDTPANVDFELEIGFYQQQPDGSFPRLRIVTEDGGMANDYIYLNRIRVKAGE